ncbi:MAG: amino acid adenylation domain-containing protein [Oscillospiraceae bacterium]|nr:amino acid adenylation domain-containing protein [Oscillospiraceae bacterium]
MTNSHPINPQPIHCLFEQQAARVPQNTALLWGDERVSYAELNALAEHAAEALRGRGIAPGSVVGAEMDRCRELIPCLLGIFKAGCAYMPLPPGLPEERRAFMLRDSEAACKLIVKNKELVVMPGVASPPQTNSTNNNDSLAYILYTSGSTGRPKGVKITQGALCNRLMWQQHHFGLTEADTLLQKTSLGFDVSLWELFWAFTVGASLRVPEPGVEKDPRRLFPIITRDGIGAVHFVPSMLTEFLEAYAAAGRSDLPLRKVIVSGEALTPALNRRFYELMGDFATLHNLYGPTECTVDVLYYDCKPGDAEIPIGKPVWNTGAHILNEDGSEVPRGAQGELCLSGAQLARGYANSALDAGRFVEHPAFGRIYRTGDMVSERTDGEILYHGRQDTQVKIRGQRVELGELESALGELAEVSQAAVLWDGARLHAYFLSALPLRGEYLRAQLAKTLPAYMLPDSFTRLDAFPLNSSGKLDRKALAEFAPRTEALPPSAGRGGKRNPQSPAEHTLAAILAKHFGKADISMAEAPLALGLDSLELVRLATLLGEQGILVAVNDLFSAPSLRALVGAAGVGDAPALLRIAGSGSGIAYIGIPYGGGGFGVYSAVAQELCTVSCETSFYAARSAHVPVEELLAAVQATMTGLQTDDTVTGEPDRRTQAEGASPARRRVVIVGSCVGFALALTLAARLENAGTPAAGVYVVSGAPAKQKKSPWRFFSDRAINQYLAKLNGQKFRLSKHELRAFRADTDFFFAWQRRPEAPAHTPVYLLTGDDDPMLRKLNAQADWERLLGCGVIAQGVPGGRHYLPHTHAGLVAGWLGGGVDLT